MPPRSMSTARNSQNQSQPTMPTGDHNRTHINVVNGRKNTPSSGHSQEPPNAALNSIGRAIQIRSTASRGNMPAKMARRQPMARYARQQPSQRVLKRVRRFGNAGAYAL